MRVNGLVILVFSSPLNPMINLFWVIAYASE